MNTADVRGCRDARADDAADVYRLLREFATSHRPDRAAFDTTTFPGVLAAAGKGHAEFLIAVSDGEVAGYALAARLPTLFAGGTILELLELAVHEPLRGRGLGSLLVREMLTRAIRAGDAEVVVPTRRAGDFYRRLGFVETATYLKVVPQQAVIGPGPKVPLIQGLLSPGASTLVTSAIASGERLTGGLADLGVGTVTEDSIAVAQGGHGDDLLKWAMAHTRPEFQ